MPSAKKLALEKKNIPKHVAVIMDGNGRWAQKRGLARGEGHRAGANAIDLLLDTALEYNIQVVSLYAFSTENWKRPRTEIRSLFQLLDFFLQDRLSRLVDKDIRLQISGDIARLPTGSRKLLENALLKTANGKTMTANFCLNYGSKQEILRAVELLLQNRQQKFLDEDNLQIREESVKKIFAAPKEKEFAGCLYTAKLPEVDLLIRTAGEKRLSNFLLYQAAYAELVFTDTLWPDFNRREFINCIDEYQRRTRKFGGLI